MERLDLSEIEENFSLFDDWEERYRYLIDLGKKVSALEEDEYCEANIVKGCTSQVWMVAHVDEDGLFHMRADSDAHIVRGLISLLMAVYSGRPANEVGAIDIEDTFDRIGLGQHLSPNRRNGFFAMVGKIKAFAQ